MYIAELHGKFSPNEERKEDILTSNVFSFFKYAKREIFLFQFLKLLNLDIDKKDLDEAEFVFWPSYEDGTEPDVVIVVGRYYLLFEAKFYSGFLGKGEDFSKHQVSREISGGKIEAKNLEKQFRFIAITAHYSKQQFLFKNLDITPHEFQWINWHQVALLLLQTLTENKTLDIETFCFADDLYSLLINKNLRKFAGVEVLTPLHNLLQIPAILFFDSKLQNTAGIF